MPKRTQNRSTPRVPAYLRHQAAGRDRAYCYIYDQAGCRRRRYLGTWNSPASKRQFRELVGTYLLNDGRLPADKPAADEGVTIAELVARFLAWAETHYVKNGRRTKEWLNMRDAAAPLLALFRDEPAAAFGPKKLRRVRDEMLSLRRTVTDSDGKKQQIPRLARKTINRRIGRIRTIFKWGVAEELIDSNVHDNLASLSPLRRSRTTAPERKRKEPVPLGHIEAVLPFLTAGRPVWARP